MSLIKFNFMHKIPVLLLIGWHSIIILSCLHPFRLSPKCWEPDAVWTEYSDQLPFKGTLHCCGVLHWFPGPSAANLSSVCRSKYLSADIWNRNRKSHHEKDSLHLHLRRSRSLPIGRCGPNWVSCSPKSLISMKYTCKLNSNWTLEKWMFRLFYTTCSYISLVLSALRSWIWIKSWSWPWIWSSVWRITCVSMNWLCLTGKWFPNQDVTGTYRTSTQVSNEYCPRPQTNTWK